MNQLPDIKPLKFNPEGQYNRNVIKTRMDLRDVKMRKIRN
jgi:hypothetical protein